MFLTHPFHTVCSQAHENEIQSAFLPWMKLGKELYTIADYLYFLRNQNINMYLSASLFQKLLMVFLVFRTLCNQKQVNICILLSYAT